MIGGYHYYVQLDSTVFIIGTKCNIPYMPVLCLVFMFNEWKSRVANWSRLKVCLQEEKEKNVAIIVAHYHSTYEPMQTIGVFSQNRKNIEIQVQMKCNES